MNGFWLLVARDLRLAWRQPTDTAVAVLFFVLTVALFPFGVGPEANILARIAPGVIWVIALLATLLALERLFATDFDDGGLDQLALGTLPLEAVALAKALAHWLMAGLPLVLVAPLLAVLMRLDGQGIAILTLAMVLGTPTLSLIGTVGAALTVGARRGGGLLALLVLPLYVPVLIFGVGAIEAEIVGLGGRPYLLILGGMFLAALALCPWAAGAGLREALR